MLTFISIPFTKMVIVWFMLFAACFHGYSAFRKCEPVYELECDDGSCISKIQWCDPLGEVDCKDGSDENYCNGTIPCNHMLHFECENKKCVPIIAVCDDYDDCYDQSDEKNCNGSSLLKDDITLMDEAKPTEQNPISKPKSFLNSISYLSKSLSSTEQTALDKAVQYLLNKENSDNGWGSFTPRAVVALSMASRKSQIAEKYKQLILKHLNIHLLKDLMKSENSTLSSLALYINALYATCQDPRNFQGIDLVARLRSETDSAIKSNSSIPLAFLTLCLSNATKPQDNFKLADLYNSKEYMMRKGSRSLIMLAMSCIMHKDRNGIFQNYESDFFSDVKAQNADIYTKALYMQASIAADSPHPIEITGQQLPDGSFGDVLSTYYAIPVLMNSSLLDLVCNNPLKGSVLESYSEIRKGQNEVIYSLWIPFGKDVVSHTINVSFYGKKSIFHIMNMAVSKDSLYKFQFDDLDPEGIRVYSIAGIPNDVESGTAWVLYLANSDNVKVNSVEGLTVLNSGVDQYFPDDKDHIIFWLKRTS